MGATGQNDKLITRIIFPPHRFRSAKGYFCSVQWGILRFSLRPTNFQQEHYSETTSKGCSYPVPAVEP